jgi:predicted DNA-binding transcriptional regulator YafY
LSVILELPIATAEARLPDTFGTLTAVPGGCRFEARVESLDWTARVLTGLGCSFTIEKPTELRAIVTKLAHTIEESARRVSMAKTDDSA